MNKTVCVLGYEPYKYSRLARQVTTYYQLIPADVFYLSPHETTQYHPEDKLPRSVTFKSSKGRKMLSFLFKFVEFYSVFYQLFKSEPQILHIIASEISAPSLLAVELFCFYKASCVVYFHLNKQCDEAEKKALVKYAEDADLKRTTFLTSSNAYIQSTGIKQEFFTEISGYVHFDQPMINRVRFLQSSAFAQPERTALGVRTAFEYFQYEEEEIRGFQCAKKPLLIAIVCSKTSEVEQYQQLLEQLEQTEGQKYCVVFTQAPCRKVEQLKEVAKIVKTAQNYYKPKAETQNKLLSENKPFANVFVSRAIFTDMDFDLFLSLCDTIIATDEKCLRDVISCGKLVISLNNDIKECKRVVECKDMNALIECVKETSGVKLAPEEDSYKSFEELMKEKIGFEIVKDLAFERPQEEKCGGCSGNCGDCQKEDGGECGGCHKECDGDCKNCHD